MNMKKIFTFKQFSTPNHVSEDVNQWSEEELGTYTDSDGDEDPIDPIGTPGSEMTLKRDEFDVIIPPGKETGEGGDGDVGPGITRIVRGITNAPGEKPLPKAAPKPVPGGKPIPVPGGDKEGGTPPPPLPKAGSKVILSDGRETTIKKVHPNGDIEV